MKANDFQIGGDHYKNMAVEPWDVVDCWSLNQRIGYYRGNALKYLMRCTGKGKMREDLMKAKHYIEKLIEVIEEAQAAGELPKDIR